MDPVAHQSIPLDVAGSPTADRADRRGRRPTSSVRIRPIGPDDDDRLREFYAGLSAESRRTRFLGASDGIGGRQSRYFCAPDHAHREGFVAVAETTDRIVGHICLEPDGRARAEVAVAVADDFQGNHVGRRLVETAVTWARAEGLETLTATMLGGNPAIQRLLTGIGWPSVAVAVGGGVVAIEIDLRSA